MRKGEGESGYEANVEYFAVKYHKNNRFYNLVGITVKSWGWSRNEPTYNLWLIAMDRLVSIKQD